MISALLEQDGESMTISQLPRMVHDLVYVISQKHPDVHTADISIFPCFLGLLFLQENGWAGLLATGGHPLLETQMT